MTMLNLADMMMVLMIIMKIVVMIMMVVYGDIDVIVVYNIGYNN